jgi:outer membrane receptor protein involved in Fe transport
VEDRRRRPLHERLTSLRRRIESGAPAAVLQEVSQSLQVFAGVDNAFDKTYYTFGTFAQLGGLPPNFNLSNPRTCSPSPTRTYFGGIRLSF